MTALQLVLKGTGSVLALVIGGTIFGWVLYNDFVERLPAFNRPPWAPTFGIAPAMIGVGLYWGWQIIQQLRGQPTKLADGEEAGIR